MTAQFKALPTDRMRTGGRAPLRDSQVVVDPLKADEESALATGMPPAGRG
ncbi:hypothetical protein [Saccharopolyspora hattusasensis]